MVVPETEESAEEEEETASEETTEAAESNEYDRTAADKMQELLYGPGLPEFVDTYCSATLGGERSYQY